MSAWKIEGQYMETCNCSFLCPCITSNLTAQPTEGDCKAAVAMRIDRGEKDGVRLDGLSFLVMLHSPGPMAEGQIVVGLIVDERATDAQASAIEQIATGAAGVGLADQLLLGAAMCLVAAWLARVLHKAEKAHLGEIEHTFE